MRVGRITKRVDHRVADGTLPISTGPGRLPRLRRHRPPQTVCVGLIHGHEIWRPELLFDEVPYCEGGQTVGRTLAVGTTYRVRSGVCHVGCSSGTGMLHAGRMPGGADVVPLTTQRPAIGRFRRSPNWAGRDSNPHEDYPQGILSPQRLPFRHPPKLCIENYLRNDRSSNRVVLSPFCRWPPGHLMVTGGTWSAKSISASASERDTPVLPGWWSSVRPVPGDDQQGPHAPQSPVSTGGPTWPCRSKSP